MDAYVASGRRVPGSAPQKAAFVAAAAGRIVGEDGLHLLESDVRKQNQQDAYEFYRLLAAELAKPPVGDANQPAVADRYTILGDADGTSDITKQEQHSVDTVHRTHSTTPPGGLTLPMRGEWLLRRRCPVCGQCCSEPTPQPFYAIELSVSEADGPSVDLGDLLRGKNKGRQAGAAAAAAAKPATPAGENTNSQHTSTDSSRGDDLSCPGCGRAGDSVREIEQLVKLPEVLAIHLNRVELRTGNSPEVPAEQHRVGSSVKFPAELALSFPCRTDDHHEAASKNGTSSDDREGRYRLYGTVFHKGQKSTQSGHYFALVRAGPTQWVVTGNPVPLLATQDSRSVRPLELQIILRTNLRIRSEVCCFVPCRWCWWTTS
eukprot:SAG31_NODE_1587_length_7819_cov_3.703277_2_plen_375_part_00